MVFDIMDVPNIHPGRSVSILRALAAWEMPRLMRGKGARGVKGLISECLIIKVDFAPLICHESTLMICHFKGNVNLFLNS